MKTTIEIKQEAFYIIRKAITLKTNVFNGCTADKEELELVWARLEKIKVWAENNNLLNDFKQFLGNGKFNGHTQFSANEVMQIFCK